MKGRFQRRGRRLGNKGKRKFEPKMILTVVLPGKELCVCPVCKVLGIGPEDVQDGIVVTPIETQEHWDALQAAHAELAAAREAAAHGTIDLD